MPLVYQQDINVTTKLGVWHISEDESFFLEKVALQKEITHLHKRLQHLAGRYLLKTICPALPLELIQVADTKKPYLKDEAWHFSIAHSGDHAAVIVSSSERVGIDIERVSPQVERIRHKFLHPDEIMLLTNLFNEGQDLFMLEWLTIAWSVKEAMYKWYGLGKVDFREEMRIDGMEWDGGRGVAHCRFRGVGLEVEFLFLDGCCLAWTSPPTPLQRRGEVDSN